MQHRRVMLISFAFPPQGGVGVLRILKFCKYLPHYGWSSLVLSHRSRPDFDVMDPALLRDVPKGTRVIRPRHLDPMYLQVKLRTLLGRADRSAGGTMTLDATSRGNGDGAGQVSWRGHLRALLIGVPDRRAGWLPSALLAGLNAARRCDCIVATGPTFTSYVVGLVLHRWTGTPLVLDFRDPWSFNPWLPKTPIWAVNANRWLEARCVNEASAVISSTQEIHDEFRRQYAHLPPGRFVTIPNGYDPQDFDGIECPGTVPGPDEPMTVAYFGSLYGNRDPAPLIEALGQLRTMHAVDGSVLKLQFVGKVHPHVLSLAATHGVADLVESNGILPYREALGRMRRSSVLLIIGAADSDRYCVATKTYEYMSAQRPILAIVPHGPIERLISGERLGVVVPPSDVSGIADALWRLLREHQLNRLEAPSSTRIARYDRRHLTGELAGVLNRVVVTRTRDHAPGARVAKPMARVGV